MLIIEVDRDSVHAGDDISSHAVSISIDEELGIEELLIKASSKCTLPKISGGKATWFAYYDSEPKQYLGVLAQQWLKPKLVISSTSTVSSVFTSTPGKLIFRYWCQSDPEAVLDALINDKKLPSMYT